MSAAMEPLTIDVPTIRRLQDSSLRDLFGVLFRHKRRSGLFLAVILALTALVTALMPRAYESDAKLLMRVGRESVAVDPTASSSGQVLSVRQSRDSEVNSELEILTSQDVIGAVVDAFGPEKFAPPGLLERLGILGSGDIRQRAILNLSTNLSIEALKDSNIISLSYSAGRPDLARDVLKKIIEVYRTQHIAAHRTVGAYQFFAQETARLGSELAGAEDKLRDAKNRAHVGSIDEQRRILMGRIGAMQQDQEQTRSALSSSKARVASMQAMLKTLPETITTEQTSGMPNAAADGMRQKIYELQLKEQDLLSRYRESSEPVQEVRRQIAEAQSLLARQDQNRTQVTEGLSASHQRVNGDLLTETAALSGLRAKSEALESELRKARMELSALNDSEVKIAQIDRQVQAQKQTLQKYSANLEQTRIDQALETEKISNISVVEQATLPSLPVSPRVLLNLVLGTFVGLLGGVAVAFGSDFVDHSIRKPSDVEERLQLPTLAAIPYQDPRRTLSRTPALRGERPRLPAGGETGHATGSPVMAMRGVSIDPSFGALRDRLTFSANGHMRTPCVVAVTSCRFDEDKSRVAASLAAVLKQTSQGRVLLLDARGLQQREQPGRVALPGFEVGTDGSLPGGAGRSCESTSASELLASLKQDYSYIVLDAPPVLGTTAGARICGQADAVILVLEAEATRWEVAREAKDLLQQARARLLGVVLNNRRYHIPHWLYERL